MILKFYNGPRLEKSRQFGMPPIRAAVLHGAGGAFAGRGGIQIAAGNRGFPSGTAERLVFP